MKIARGCRPASVRRFYKKLLLLKDLMNTPGARAAEARRAFTEAFLREWAEETRG